MTATLPKEFPFGLKDDEIAAMLRDYTEEIFKDEGQINTVLVFTPLIHLGQMELQKRAAERVARTTTIVSYASVAVAAIALVISVLNTMSSARWEERQVKALQSIESNLTGIAATAKEVKNALRAQAPSPSGRPQRRR